MTRKLYDLVGADPEVRFSPYCNRIRRALRLKGLEYETVPVRFTDKDLLEFSGQKLVPVLVDGERVVTDSWQIALYLDETYGGPALMGSDAERALTLNFKHFVETVLGPAMLRVVLLDIYKALGEKDQAYFRQTREARFNCTLEEFHQGEAAVPALRKLLDPVRLSLKQMDYVAGSSPGFADFCLAGMFDWGRAVSDVAFLEADDPIAAWYARLDT